jgi:hypothetical protein
MGTGRRLALLLIALTLIGVPAAALRVGCAGASCASSAAAGTPAPFCALPADLQALITAGTYEGRSPDALGVAGDHPVVSIVDAVRGRSIRVLWPSASVARAPSMSAPLVFIGRNIQDGALPSATGLDQIAPTLEPILGFQRPHPEVRDGRAIAGVAQARVATRLVVLIVWKGVGTADVDAARPPWLEDPQPLSRSGSRDRAIGIAQGPASAGSLPLDPVAVESTIGTGALPSQHGITGTWLRGPDGRITFAYGRGAPSPVVAALGDDLDGVTNGRSKIGLIQEQVGDVGLTGDAWYGIGPVRDRSVVTGSNLPAQVAGFLRDGWGADVTPDLLAVSMMSSVAHDDEMTSQIVDEVLARVPTATIVVAGTGTLRTGAATVTPMPTGVDPTPGGGAAGGFFIDGSTDNPRTAQDVVDAMRTETAPDGTPLYEDSFASYAVRFGRYC